MEKMNFPITLYAYRKPTNASLNTYQYLNHIFLEITYIQEHLVKQNVHVSLICMPMFVLCCFI